MQIAIVISVLLAGLIYLHVKRDRLIFQRDVKVAGTLATMALVMLAATTCGGPMLTLFLASNLKSNRPIRTNGEGFVVLGMLFVLVIWTLVIVAYGKFFDGCRKAAFFSRVEAKDPVLRAKVREILLSAIKQKWCIEEFEIFIQVNHQDPLVEEVRCECEKMHTYGTFSEKYLETLKGLADKLEE
jgi:hypothetical protein